MDARLALCVLCSAFAAHAPAQSHPATAPDVREELRAFFAAPDAASAEQIARRIEARPDYDRAKISQWLHEAIPFPKYSQQNATIHVSLPNNQQRAVELRLPKDYDPARAWPLIYALHGQGSRAAEMMRYVEGLLGKRVEEFVIAAPDQFAEYVIHQASWPPIGEHRRLIEGIRRQVNVNSDRVFCLGYSRGGHTAWTLAITDPDLFAGVIPLAGTFLMVEIDRLWEHMLPNLRNTRVLCVWGAGDVNDDHGQASADGGIAGLNRRLRELAAKMELPVTMIELADAGHTDVTPPLAELENVLNQRRAPRPQRVRSAFRHICQGHAYWLEGESWTGPEWGVGAPKIELKPGEDASDAEAVRRALARGFRTLMGELSGEIDEQRIAVHRKQVDELTVWLEEGMVDWARPLLLKVSARKSFEGPVSPDLFICLAQARRTYDFDRLRWAGLKYRTGGKTRPVSGTAIFDASAP